MRKRRIPDFCVTGFSKDPVLHLAAGLAPNVPNGSKAFKVLFFREPGTILTKSDAVFTKMPDPEPHDFPGDPEIWTTKNPLEDPTG
ncbi:MAG: hypothetical protein EOP85_04100 [Verrucomicrobiaceae bacterium]|nr:MAG: hypothetical protein EOP85_04100 [Verrucomicrobiaceae bacterium]